MIKLEIEYFDKKEINTYDIDDVKFLCDERKVEIPGMMPYYEGQIELVSTDKNLIDFLNPSNNLEEIARDILHHKCIMTSYYSIKDIYINCTPYFVKINYDKPNIIIDCTYKTYEKNNLKEEICGGGDL